ncbi:MAG: hypothetical protein ACE5LU_02170 [Anaerolineae bacterium]
MELGEQVIREMERLWRKSIEDMHKGVVREYAATLVEEQDGKLKLVNPVEGTSRGVAPNLEIPEGVRFVGTFHTHPYEDGTTAAFSGQDIAASLAHRERISLVRSGDDVFALVRTDKTLEKVNTSRVNREFGEEVRKHLDKTGVSFSEAVYLANIELCSKHGLAFYRGRGGKLKEVYVP